MHTLLNLEGDILEFFGIVRNSISNYRVFAGLEVDDNLYCACLAVVVDC